MLYSTIPSAARPPPGALFGSLTRASHTHTPHHLPPTTVPPPTTTTYPDGALFGSLDRASPRSSSRLADVVALCGKIWPWLCVFILVDGTFGLFRGVLLALGQQQKMSLITVLSLWCIGLPASIHYVFGLNQGLLGLWQITPFIYLVFDTMLAYGCITSPWVPQVQS